MRRALTSLVLLAACGSVDGTVVASSVPAVTATTIGAGTDDTATTDPGTADPGAPGSVGTSTIDVPGSTTATARSERPLPAGPLALAADLNEAERAIRSDEVVAAEATLWGRRLQRLYRVLSANRGWAAETIAAVDDDLRADVELNWTARQELSSLVGSSPLSSTLPAWRIREPLPADQLIGYYEEAEQLTGVPWEILAAINLIETRLGRIEGLSTAGAVGPMQFLPSTWADCCEGDPTEDRDAIIGAGNYLLQRGAATDLDRALLGYNNSGSYVRAVRAYADVLGRNPLAFRGYHAFDVFFLSTAGLIRLPVGYAEPEPVDAVEWLVEHPEALVE